MICFWESGGQRTDLEADVCVENTECSNELIK